MGVLSFGAKRTFGEWEREEGRRVERNWALRMGLEMKRAGEKGLTVLKEQKFWGWGMRWVTRTNG